jgi:hypothetical protein
LQRLQLRGFTGQGLVEAGKLPEERRRLSQRSRCAGAVAPALERLVGLGSELCNLLCIGEAVSLATQIVLLAGRYGRGTDLFDLEIEPLLAARPLAGVFPQAQ